MIPEVVFHRSTLYDRALKRDLKFKVVPKESFFAKKINSYEKLWSKEGGRILRELERVNKLKWHTPEIICYVTWGVIPYSDPLTLNTSGNARDTRDTLTHELIHRILSQRQNPGRLHRNWQLLMKRYREYPPQTKTHVVINAIHEHILRKFYGEERLRHEVNYIKNPNYRLAWQVVARDGYENIISELTKGLGGLG